VSPSPNILVGATSIDPPDRRRLSAEFPAVHFTFATDPDQALTAAPDAEIIFTKGVEAKVIGAEGVTVEALAARGIPNGDCDASAGTRPAPPASRAPSPCSASTTPAATSS